MSHKRSTISKLSGAVPTNGQAVAVGAPSWAKRVIVHLKGTTAGASTIDFALVLDSGDLEGTEITILAATQIAASATDAQRYLALGEDVPESTTANRQTTGFPLSARLKGVFTIAGTVSDVDLDYEFLGE